MPLTILFQTSNTAFRVLARIGMLDAFERKLLPLARTVIGNFIVTNEMLGRYSTLTKHRLPERLSTSFVAVLVDVRSELAEGYVGDQVVADILEDHLDEFEGDKVGVVPGDTGLGHGG